MGGGHLQVADESFGDLQVKKAVDMESLLIENEAGEFGSDTLVSAQSSTSAGSYIMGIAYVPAPDVQDREFLTIYSLSATAGNSQLELVNQSPFPTRSEGTESNPERTTILSGECELSFGYRQSDIHNTAMMSLGSSYDRLTFVGVNNVKFTEPASNTDFRAYFGY